MPTISPILNLRLALLGLNHNYQNIEALLDFRIADISYALRNLGVKFHNSDLDSMIMLIDERLSKLEMLLNNLELFEYEEPEDPSEGFFRSSGFSDSQVEEMENKVFKLEQLRDCFYDLIAEQIENKLEKELAYNLSK